MQNALRDLLHAVDQVDVVLLCVGQGSSQICAGSLQHVRATADRWAAHKMAGWACLVGSCLYLSSGCQNSLTTVRVHQDPSPSEEDQGC